MKQGENLKKQIDEDEFLAKWSPVKAHLCKQQATALLNKIFTSQAFHNSIDLSTLGGGKLTMVDD